MIPDDNQLFERVTTGDKLVGSQCFACELKAALFVMRGQYVAVCPGCAAQRLEQMRAEYRSLPKWLRWFGKELENEVRYQRRKQENPFELSFDDLHRCVDCGKVVHRKDARYYFAPGSHISEPRCQDCFDQRLTRNSAS